MIDSLQLLANPVVRKIIPVIGDIGSALGIAEVKDSPEIDRIVDFVKRLVPVVSSIRERPVHELGVDDLSNVLRAFGVNLSGEDVDRWITVIRANAGSADQTVSNFLTSGDFKNMLVKVMTGEKQVVPPISSLPKYDPSTGIYDFTGVLS